MVALGRRAHRVACRRLRHHGRRPRRERARRRRDLPEDRRGGVHGERVAVGDARLGDADPLHGARRGRGVPDGALQHRGGGAALPRRGRRLLDRAPARRPRCRLDTPVRRLDVHRRRRARRALGAHPRRAQGVREHQRDHHVADAQLRRRAAPHVSHLRQRVVLARRVDTPGASVSPGQADASGRRVAQLRLERRRPARLPHRDRRRRRALVPVLAHALRLRSACHRRLAARCALCRHAHAAQDPRRHGPLRRGCGYRGSEPGRRVLAHARRQPTGPAGGGVRLHGHRRRGARALQPARRLPRSRAHRRTPERRLYVAGGRLPLRPRRCDAGNHPLLRARGRASDPVPIDRAPALARHAEGGATPEAAA